MKNSIHELMDKWNSLELELLVPAKLTRDDWTAISAARSLNYSIPAFRQRLPITIAHFKDTAARRVLEDAMAYPPSQEKADLSPLASITRWAAKKMKQLTAPSPPVENPFVVYSQEYEEKFHMDAFNMFKILFNTEIKQKGFSIDARIGFFEHARAPHLHADHGFGAHAPFLIARLGELPIWYLQNQVHRKPSEEVAELLKIACLEHAKPHILQKAIEELYDRRVLAELPLGDVGLMVTSPWDDGAPQHSIEEIRHAGNLHCSSPVPPSGKHSAFFRAFGPGV